MAALLAGEGVVTVLIRPDLDAFGSGEAQDLMRTWNQALTGGGV